MIFSLYIQSPPCSATSLSAFQFAEALLSEGHQLYRVFFHYDGVYHASSLTCPPQGVFDLVESWRKLQISCQLELAVCIAAALKRGILDDKETARHEKSAANLLPGFQLSGLGQLVDAVDNSDRLITFGG